MSDELHKLAFEYRTALSYVDTLKAYKALEAYEQTLLNTLEVQTRRNLQRTAQDMGLTAGPATRAELLQACKEQHQAIDWLMACLIDVTRDSETPFMPSQSPIWPAVTRGHAAIQRAEEFDGGRDDRG